MTHRLLEFKAGRCFREGETNTVKPDPAKGLVYMSIEDDFTHFYWEDRTTHAVEDLILFPGDKFLPVPECTTGRVFVLQFKSSSELLFFWLQEASTERDAIILSQINTLVNQSGDADIYDDEDVTMEGAEDSEMAPASTEPVTTTTSATSAAAAASLGNTSGGALSAAQMDTLRNILGGIQMPTNVGGGHTGRSTSGLRLDHVLTPQAIIPLLKNPEFCSALFPHLPEGSANSPEEIQAVVRTPQFSAALVSLSTALESGQLGPLLRQFGLGSQAGDGVEGFLEAVEEQAKNNKK